MKTVLIIGLSRKSMHDHILSMGHEYVVLQDIRKAKNKDKRLKRRVLCDFSSNDSINLALQEVTDRYTIDGIFVTYENYVLPAAFIADTLDLPGMPLESATACTDKELMRKLFSSAPQQISPAFAQVSTEAEAVAFAESHSFPLILKPANLAKSLLVTKNADLNELKTNFSKTIASIDEIYNKYAPNRTPKILIEEFLEGTIHSVDAFIDSNGTPHVLEQVVDYQTGYDIGYDDNFHYSRIVPTTLANEDVKAIRETAALGCKALGMKSSPAHIEIILTSKGPRIVEIGARNGGYRERMHSMAHGIDITKNALAVAFDEPLQLEATKNDSCAVLELFPRQAGVFASVNHEAELQRLPSLNYYSLKAAPGDYIGKSSDGYKMTAIIILHNSNRQQFLHDLAYVNSHVTVATTHNQ